MQKDYNTYDLCKWHAFVDLPTDFLEIVQLYVDGNPNVVLDYVNPNQIELNNLTDS
jgi:hypothetical protein